MENQLALNEIRKAQVELNDAFSFRRSINTESLISTTTEEPSNRLGSSAATEQQQQPELVAAGVATVSSPGSIPKKKKRRKVKRQPAVVEDIDMSDDSQFESMTTAFENAEEERMRHERLARLEASLEESDRLWEQRMQEMEEKEQKPCPLNMKNHRRLPLHDFNPNCRPTRISRFCRVKMSCNLWPKLWSN